MSRRLGDDGDLSTRQAAATIRLAISKVPQIWKDRHVSLGAPPKSPRRRAWRKPRARTDEKKHFKPDPGHPGVYHRKVKTRFYGVKTLNSDNIALDFKNVDEIIANLRQDGTELVVKIEIEATKSSSFEEGQVRTVSEKRPDPKVRPVWLRGELSGLPACT